jgi:hypothetical protein
MSLTPVERTRLRLVERSDATDAQLDDAKRGGRDERGWISRWNTIKPYWHDGAWVFDDPVRRLQAKPFVARAPKIIDQVLRRAGLPSRQPFTVTFGDRESPGPGYRFVLEWAREDRDGHWYRWGGMEGLCPALVRYFDAAPMRIFCVVAARRTPFFIVGAAT